MKTRRWKQILWVVLLLGTGQQVGGLVVEYDEAPSWPLPAITDSGTSTSWNFGQVAAVATNVDGDIVVLHRGADPVMVFDTDGRFIRSWGNGLFSNGKVVGIDASERTEGTSRYTVVYGSAGCYACGAHSVRVDAEGNIWVVDAAGHVVYKMDDTGRVLMELGTRGTAGISRHTFNLPTDVAFAPNGDVYVSDGYGNPRIVKYAADGQYLLEWGRRGIGPGEFGLPHNLVVDSRGRVYVTDRDNNRVQVFDPEGQFLAEWPNIDGVSSLFLTDEQHIWVGGVLRNLEGLILARLLGTTGGHGTTVSPDGAVFVAQLDGRVQKFLK